MKISFVLFRGGFLPFIVDAYYTDYTGTTDRTTTTESFTTCEPKVWFVEQPEKGLSYAEMNEICIDRARKQPTKAAGEVNIGFLAFFRNQEEYDQYKKEVDTYRKPLYLGYEQRYGDNNEWVNADGTQVTFTDWELNWNDTPQPNRADEPCVISWMKYFGPSYDRTYGSKWHDVECSNDRHPFGDSGFACRFETYCPIECERKVWFVEQPEIGISYAQMKRNCAARAQSLEIWNLKGKHFGYPAFFYSEDEYNQYKKSVNTYRRKMYLGYEQRYGDNTKWYNADGMPAQYFDWELNWNNTPQPNRADEPCVISWMKYFGPSYDRTYGSKWHDVECSNDRHPFGDSGYACRFENICQFS